MTSFIRHKAIQRKAVWGDKHVLLAVAALVCGFATPAFAGDPHAGVAIARPGSPNAAAINRHSKLDNELAYRATYRPPTALTRVIVTLKPGAKLPIEYTKYARRGLGIINSQVLTLPNGSLRQLAAHPAVYDVHFDRPLHKDNYRTSITTGARAVNHGLGYTGHGIGVAVIDSGIAQWHDDFTDNDNEDYPFGNQRVSAFVDFVNGGLTPYDDEGHGTHVAGIIAGNGADSGGHKSGIAPEASLVSLKVLDADGHGTVSNIIAALEWVLANHLQYKIRVVNLSIGAAVTESYWTDPLTLAAKRVVDAGVVVVAAAGNGGKNAAGQPQYGAIVAPANAPWVLTVGASSTNGTTNRSDDTVATYSSRGPTYLDWSAKPDLVAPGTGTISLADPAGTFYTTKSAFLMDGSIATAFKPYLTLTGTSMAAPVVSGTVALMLQANPNLTPNAVKALLQYTAEANVNYNGLTEGAGFLNTFGAVRLAKFYATAQPGDQVPTQNMWSKHIVWGNHMLTGGLPSVTANAFSLGTNWGVAKTDTGDNIVWGTECADAGCSNIVWGTDTTSNIVWGTTCGDAACSNIVWGTDVTSNIVWGTDCGGADCDNIVWGTVDASNIVWGTADVADNIVWGTDGSDANIVWGTNDADLDNIVWGTDEGALNIVWGTDTTSNIVWGTDADNIVWGTAADNIVWGTSDNNIVWGTSASDGTITQSTDILVLTDEGVFHLLNWVPPPTVTDPAPTAPPPPTTTSPSTTDSTTTSSTSTTTDSTSTTSTSSTTTTDPTSTSTISTTTTDPTSTTSTTDPASTSTTSTTTTDSTATGTTVPGGF